MDKTELKRTGWALIASVVLAALLANPANGAINGITGTTFNFTARVDYISMPDGGTAMMWGYGDGGGRMQYPGPTLIVNQGDEITINLTNELPVATSIVFPGQSHVAATGGSVGILTREAAAGGGTVSYKFTATHAGTYQYHSGSRPELQIEMGLLGALIVRPEGFDPANPTAYNHPDSAYDYEHLFLFTEMDPVIHQLVEFGREDEIDNPTYYPVYWFINGRCFPDIVLPAYYPMLPTQPYTCLPRMHPGEKILKRIIGAGRDLHPHHTHGNNITIIAQDGRLLSTGSGVGADLSYSDYTLTVAPGNTFDATFTWTGKGLGWDIYGHSPDDPLEENEYAPDHGKPFPVILPVNQELTLGGLYSGSPFLGTMISLPPGVGGINNLFGGYFYPWHSHSEKEIVNNDIFIGGMVTFVIIEPFGVPIE